MEGFGWEIAFIESCNPNFRRKIWRAAEPPMTLDFIMSRTIEHIQHPNNHVRSAAINVCMACYKFCGADVEIYFGGLRKSLLDLLHAGFLEVEDEKIRERDKNRDATKNC